MAAISRSCSVNIGPVFTQSVNLDSLIGYMPLPPVAHYGVTSGQKNTIQQINGMTIFCADTLTLETWVQNAWGKHVLYAATPNYGDSLTYNSLTSLWETTPVNRPLLSQLRVYNDATDIVQVKRVYSGNTLTNTSGNTTATMTPSGVHTLTGSTNKSYRITIDSAGTADWSVATFKWSNDGGTTFSAFAVPVATGTATGRKVLAPITLDNGVSIQFTTGVFGSGDRWDFVAIASGNQVYDLTVDTTNSAVQVGSQLQVVDANFALKHSTFNPTIIFDSGDDYLQYSRSANDWTFRIGGNDVLNIGVALIQAAQPITVTGSITTTSYIDLGSISTPSSPAGGDIKFYNKSGIPIWLPNSGVEGRIARTTISETITANWTFSSTTMTLASTTIAGAVTASGAWTFTAGGGVTVNTTLTATTLTTTDFNATGAVSLTGGSYSFDAVNIALSTPAASTIRYLPFAKATGAYQDTPRFMDASTHDSGTVMRALNLQPMPIFSPTQATGSYTISTILGMTGLVYVPCGITLHSLSYDITAAAVGSTGLVRMALYTESGALITGTNVTDNPAAAVTGVRTVNLSGDVYLPAGNYYQFMCIATAYGTTDPKVAAYTLAGTAAIYNSTSLIKTGTVVCTGGAAPSPLGTITAVNSSTPILHWTGSAT